MNRWRVAGLIVLAALAVLLTLRACAPDETPVNKNPVPAREKFHVAKPLRLLVRGDSGPWLSRELRNLLLRGQMRLITDEPQKNTPFTLQVELASTPPAQVKLSLLAPDGVVERSLTIDVHTDSRLATIQDLARQLPDFLHAAHPVADWSTFPGTEDATAYENFLLSAAEILGPAGTGFTQPPASTVPRTVDRLEALTRKQRTFARAAALLALSYLSLGGKDEASLTQLAQSTAQRALTLDAALADAHSALGLASLRRGEWGTATEHFDAALALDADALPALEGSACLLVDAGRAAAALPLARRAVALQAGNLGANECLVYAQLATAKMPTNATAEISGIREIARVQALAAILSGNMDRAQLALRGAKQASKPDTWIEPLLSAAANKDKHTISAALQAITLAASDGSIDPATEILSGAALRQSEFVFNRMQRLYKQKESVPLRILWLPQTDFLRRHSRFEQTVGAAALLPFWQEHGLPDMCAGEPGLYGCKMSSPAGKKPASR